MHHRLADTCINSSTNSCTSYRNMVKIGPVVCELKQGGRSLWNRGDMPPPPIFRKGDIHGNVPQYFRSDVVYHVDSSDNCCLLYLNTNIMCSFTKKASASGGLRPPDSLPGLHPWIPLGDGSPPDSQSSFMSPNNPVRSTPLCKLHIGYNEAPHTRPQNHSFPWTDTQTQLSASSLDPSDLSSQTASISDQPFCHNAPD